MRTVAKWPGEVDYGDIKRKVLRWRLKEISDEEDLIERGISFQSRGAADENARRPNSVLVLGTWRSC